MPPSRSDVTPSGKFGFRVRAQQRASRREPYTILMDHTEEFPDVPAPNPALTASVGLSISAGMKHADFARQTIEVSAWCTMPCEPTPEAMSATYDECYNHVITQVNNRMIDAAGQFFPDVLAQNTR